ncbi:hypothetical protein BC831DRAFT_463144 [Entophlyctis helioformis]|nr:hypothetical protein BC831DRAFT_463144 [Entophlyctis helioformis]
MASVQRPAVRQTRAVGPQTTIAQPPTTKAPPAAPRTVKLVESIIAQQAAGQQTQKAQQPLAQTSAPAHGGSPTANDEQAEPFVSTAAVANSATSPTAANAGSRPILEIQQMAPAPGQTFFQLSVMPVDPRLDDKESAGHVAKKRGRTASNSKRTATTDAANTSLRMRQGCVILRDWPRKRMSQTWSRSGMLNPSQKIISFQEFLDGELRDEITYIFGEEQYKNVLKSVKKAVYSEDDDEDMADDGAQGKDKQDD